MPRFDTIAPRVARPEPADVSYAEGLTVDIVIMQGGTEQIICHDCVLTTLAKASHLFERIAHDACKVPRGYGCETKLRYMLPRGIAGAAFLRILEWLNAIEEISAHGEIEDPQISTFPDDGLMQYLRLLQAATLLELKHPFANQKRLPDMIKANIKKAFDTKDNKFRNVTIRDAEIGVIWDMSGGDRNEPVVKLMLALFVEALDLRKDKETAHRYKDDIARRFEALLVRNAGFRSAVFDVKMKKEVRKREEERERRGQPKVRRRDQQPRQHAQGGRRGGGGAAKKGPSSGEDDWDSKELTEGQVRALMSRPEVFPVMYKNGFYDLQDGDNADKRVEYSEEY